MLRFYMLQVMTLCAYVEFRNKYRNIDVLLIDDIQFIIGKDRCQEEFFHTFNTLYEAKKQIIISSDKPPKEMVTLEERLRSRFMWGLPVDIYPPDFELRCRIIKEKIKNTSIENKIDEDVIEYIANACPSDVRHIEAIIAKQRNGRTGIAHLLFSKQFSRYDSMSKEWENHYEELAKQYPTD